MRGPEPELNFPHARFFLTAAAIAFVSWLIVSTTAFDPPAGNLEARITAAQMAGDKKELVGLYDALLAGDEYNVEHHYNYVHAVDALPRISRRRHDYVGTPDPKVGETRAHYEQWTKSPDPRKRDIGYYCLGLMEGLSKHHDKAIPFFDKVANRELPYLNNSHGYALLHLTDTTTSLAAREAVAEKDFLREIKVGGNKKGACGNLSKMYAAARRFDDLDKLVADPALKGYFSPGVQRLVLIHRGDWAEYLRSVPRTVTDHLNLISLFGALAGALVWYYYFRRVDAFEPEKHRYLLLTFAGGALSGLLALCLYDVLDYRGISLPGTNGGDFIYCVFGIGLVEEIAKIIPFLAILIFTRQCNESVDYVVYASMAALGFATAENIMYLDRLGSHVLFGRTVVSATLHMFDVSVIAYGIIIARYRNWGTQPRNFIVFLMLAVLMHGVFDYCLLSDFFPGGTGAVLAFAFSLLAFLLFGVIIANAQSQSCFFDTLKGGELINQAVVLGFGLLGVAAIEYVLEGFQSGPTLANKAGVHSAFFMFFMIYMLCGALSAATPGKGHWLCMGGRELPVENRGEQVILSREPGGDARVEDIDPRQEGAFYTWPVYLRINWQNIAIGPFFFSIMFMPFLLMELHRWLGLAYMVFWFFGIFALCVIAKTKFDRFVWRERAVNIISRRTRRILDPTHKKSLFVDVVPRRAWTLFSSGAGKDLGFLAISAAGHIVFEGSSRRIDIPPDAVSYISIAPSRPVKDPTQLYCVLKCRTPDGELEIPLRIRDNYEGKNWEGLVRNEHERASEVAAMLASAVSTRYRLNRSVAASLSIIKNELY